MHTDFSPYELLTLKGGKKPSCIFRVTVSEARFTSLKYGGVGATEFPLLPAREEGLGHIFYELSLLKRIVKTVQWHLDKSVYFVSLISFLLLKILVQQVEGKVTHFNVDN